MTSYIHVFTSLCNSKASSVFEEQCLASSSFLEGSLLASFSLFAWQFITVKKGKKVKCLHLFQSTQKQTGIH